MSEAKFTKGEWWVNHIGPHWNNPEIASYEICWSPDAECVVDHVYELADAHLIAAAPEMYAMLQALRDECEMFYSEFGEPSNGEYTAAFCDVDKLLAKARGEL